MTKSNLYAGNCYTCKGVFEFNIDYRPAYGNTRGLANLICKPCLDKTNKRRRALGLAPHTVSAFAYVETVGFDTAAGV